VTLLLCLLFTTRARGEDSTIGAAGLDDPFMPSLGNGGYDVQHYTLNLDVDIDRRTLYGITTMEAYALQDLTAFNLDFIGMKVEGVRVNGDLSAHSRSGRELTIYPAQMVADDSDFTVEVTYSGSPRGGESAYWSFGWRWYDEGVFSVNQPMGAQYWFPCNDHPSDKASYTMRITAPKPYEVAANGTLTDVLDQGDRSTYIWDAPQQMATYLTTVHIGQFTRVDLTSQGGIPIRNYYSQTLDIAQLQNFGAQGAMMDYYVELLGPYPFDAYGAVVMNLELQFAMETQTLSTFGRTFITERVIAHELAHQWTGNSLTLRTWGDLWLNEGFAEYLAWMWIEHRYGRDALASIINDEVAVLFGNPAFMIGVTPPGRPPNNNLFNMGVYYRGALTLHALRERVGDGAFVNILRAYVRRYQYANVSTADFISVAQEISGQDLTLFFEQWLYEEKMPPIPLVQGA
jgi:aminopeptidase N